MGVDILASECTCDGVCARSKRGTRHVLVTPPRRWASRGGEHVDDHNGKYVPVLLGRNSSMRGVFS